MAVSANRLELLQIADAVAREKAIDRGIVIAAMEDAIQKAARSRYGAETEVRAEINPKTGEMRLSRLLLVVDTVENSATQISLDDARRRHPAAQIGDTIADPLPPLEYGRMAAQSAKQVIVQKVREAERDRQYQEYKDRIGDIVNGLVKRVEYGNVVVDLGRGEAIVRRDEMLPREVFRNGDRIRAYIYDVRREARGPQIFLSRTHPQFMAKLFAQEVPEIYDSIVEVKAVARDPGSRAKIAVISRDSSVDPVGACVGMRGSRVQAVVDEVVGQLLASEGFTSVEELAFVDEKEIASIEGFDADTAQELQTRARDYLARIEEEFDAKRRELGVEDALKEVPGVATRMLVAFGENGIKSVEDLAGCATDELSGWTERKEGETIRHPGILDGFDVTREDAEAIIMQARVKAGWIDAADLAPPAEAEPAETTEVQG